MLFGVRRAAIAMAALAQFGMATLPLCDLDLFPGPASTLDAVRPATAWTTPESGHQIAPHDPATCPVCLVHNLGSRPEGRAELPALAVAPVRTVPPSRVTFVPPQFILSQAPRAPPIAL